MDDKELDKKEIKDSTEVDGLGPSLRWYGLGFELLGLMCLFGYLGYLLDNKIETMPLWTILGILTALIGRIYLLLKETKPWK